MRRISTHLAVLVCIILFHQKSFSQPLPNIAVLSNNECNQVNFPPATGQDFNNPADSMAGFSGLGWTYFFQGNNGFILAPDAPAGAALNLVSPTYSTAASTINVKFTLGGTAKISSVFFQIRTAAGELIPVAAPAAITNLPPGNQTLCLVITGLNAWIQPGERFLFVISVSIDPNSGANKNLTFDNYFINNVVEEAPLPPLPVRFTSLDARTVSNGVNISWNVGTEESLLGYDIEKSTNGSDFVKVGFVPAADQPSYHFLDTKPVQGTTYYRIKMVDIDGKFKYSTIVVLKNGKAVIVLRAFPIPAQSEVTIQHPTADAGSKLTVNGADGRLIRSLVPTPGSQQTKVDLFAEKAGLYMIHFDNGKGETGTLKLIKQ